MSGPTLSVVMPNYNHGRYLGDSLGAIVTQSFPPREVIVVDDASTDDSVSVIESFTRRYPFVRLLRHARNLGAIVAANRGLSSATGDYVFFHPADDKVLPGFLEKSMALLAAHPGAGLCCTRARMLGLDGEDLGLYHTPEICARPRYFSPEELLDVFLRHRTWFVTYSAIYKRSAVLELGGMNPELGPTADAFLLHVISRRYGACHVPEPLVAWRKSDQSYALKNAGDYRDSLRLVELLDDALSNPPYRPLFPPAYVRAWRRQVRWGVVYELGRRAPDRPDQTVKVLEGLPDPDWLDALFLESLRLNLLLTRLATKLYLFVRQNPDDRRRIVREKLEKWLG